MSTKKLLPIFVLAALLSSVPADGKPKNFRTLQLLALKEMQATVIAAQKSDDIMLKEIDTVANQLQRFLNSRARTQRSEPLYMRKSEADALKRQLASNLGANPYADNPYLKGSADDSAPATHPKIETRLSNSNNQSAHGAGSSSDRTESSGSSSPLSNQPSALQNINVFETKPVRQLNAPRVNLVSTPDASCYDVAALRKEVPEDWHAEPGTIQIVHNGRDLCFIWGAGIEGRPVFDRDKQRFKVISMRVGLR